MNPEHEATIRDLPHMKKLCAIPEAFAEGNEGTPERMLGLYLTRTIAALEAVLVERDDALALAARLARALEMESSWQSFRDTSRTLLLDTPAVVALLERKEKP